MQDFDAYLSRIGLNSSGAATWQEIHRAHATTIPFENLDSHRGIPISLDQDALERKLVAARRGGYCFEHNLLLASALEHLGLQVDPMLARVRVGGAPPEARPAGHLVLRVTDQDRRQWHADVGFGLGTLLDPIPFGPSGVQEQSGWKFQVVEEDEDLVLQTMTADGWSDVYGFPPEPALRIDIEVNNWWICTNPASPFVFGLIVSKNRRDGGREAMYDWSGTLQAVEMNPDGVVETAQQRDAIPSLLADRFDLPGFELGPDGRVKASD
ncbi:MAG: arylamine N-acetyltransferase family protein [Acidimicrobiales bacterium]